ncbi:MAG: hypothetical protein K6E10_08430 [Eubacterium sp.]|nr:hypothetical protein [Eubacterium sp.]
MKRFYRLLMSVLIVIGMVFGGTGLKSLKSVNAAYATPRLIVTGCDIKGGNVKAGDEFEMTLHLKNESSSTKLTNISLKLSSQDNQIVSTSGSDSIYIDSLDKDQEYDVKVTMKTKEDLTQKNYSISVDYKYEDNSRNSFEDSASLVVPVVQEARLGISELKLSKKEVTVNGKNSLSFKINNMGLDKLRNVTVELSGDTIDDVTYYAGTIETGLNSSVDLTITPIKVGDSDVNIKVIYEDTLGNKGSIEDKIGMVAIEEVALDIEEEEFSFSPAMIGGGAGIIIFLIIIVSIIKKRNQKKYE